MLGNDVMIRAQKVIISNTSTKTHTHTNTMSTKHLLIRFMRNERTKDGIRFKITNLTKKHFNLHSFKLSAMVLFALKYAYCASSSKCGLQFRFHRKRNGFPSICFVDWLWLIQLNMLLVSIQTSVECGTLFHL